MFEDSRTVLAHHEAGHAVLAWIFGLEIESVSILPNAESDGVAVIGSFDGVSFDPYKGSAESALLRAHALTFLAGEIAGSISAGAAPDWLSWEKSTDGEKYVELAIRLGWYEFTDPGGFETRDLAENASEVRSLLVERWVAVEALAARLLEVGQISGKEALQTITSAGVPGPVASAWGEFQAEVHEEEELRRALELPESGGL